MSEEAPRGGAEEGALLERADTHGVKTDANGAVLESSPPPATSEPPKKPSIPVPSAPPRPAAPKAPEPKAPEPKQQEPDGTQKRTSTMPGAASVPPEARTSSPPAAPVIAPAPTSPTGALIPGPAPLPYLPDGSPTAAKSPSGRPPPPPSSPPPALVIDDLEPVPAAPEVPDAPLPAEAAARRRSRRTVKIPDDAVPIATSPSGPPPARVPSRPPPALASDYAGTPGTAGYAGTPRTPGSSAALHTPATSSDPDPDFADLGEVIRPMRIITVGDDSPVIAGDSYASFGRSEPDRLVAPFVFSVAARQTAGSPSAAEPAPIHGRAPMPAAPESFEEIEPERSSEPEVVDDTISEEITQERKFAVSEADRADFEGRGEEESIEEIEPESDGTPTPAATDELKVAPKKPPPPPPPPTAKRTQTPLPGDLAAIAASPPPPAPAAAAPATATAAAATPAAATPAAAPAEAPAAAATSASVGTAQTPAREGTPLVEPITRKRQKPWWEELFGDDFIRTMDRLETKNVRREVDFIEESLGVEKGAVILDLACGVGSHAVELASRGYSVVGYDLSLAMLARAADEAQERGQKLNFLQGDMREMAFDEMFDGVYCWNMSYGYFDDEKNLSVLQRAYRALRQGGMLLLDISNRDYVAPRSPSLVWFEGDGCVCMDEMHLDFFSSRLKVKRTAMFEDGRTRELDYSIRLYALHELGKMLHDCGFKVVEVTGHPAHPGVFFGAESPRVIVLAERS